MAISASSGADPAEQLREVADLRQPRGACAVTASRHPATSIRQHTAMVPHLATFPQREHTPERTGRTATEAAG